MIGLLEYAVYVARKGARDSKQYLLGAVAIRNDGCIVHARNAASAFPSPRGHAEVRLMQKAGRHAVVYVARVRRDGGIVLARPCGTCIAIMRAHNVKRIYYTISEKEYGVIIL